jgi:tetratricopeptide (TPR) repeat protein
MYLSGNHLQLRRNGRQSDPRRIILLLSLILGGVLILGLNVRGEVRPLFEPTPAPTREAVSYAEEGEALFAAGKLPDAITAYQQATRGNAINVDYWVALARIQIYDRQYESALATAQNARLLAPNNVKAQAIYAWAAFWNYGLTGCKCTTQQDAMQAARTAIALDRNYAPAHAYYSEILCDSGDFTDAASQAQQALALDPNSLDARRAMGNANDAVGNYAQAAERYKSALALNPNLITLYLRLGRSYQALAQSGQLTSFQPAIDAFSKANAIDQQNIEPYLDLSDVYYVDDQLGVAEQYLDQALVLAPDDPSIHGKLGLLLFRRKNYEGAEPELSLAVNGGRYVVSKDKTVTVKGLPLDKNSLEFYYTYGNLMAFNLECTPDKAPAILKQVLDMFPDDPTVKGSYDESMKICTNYLSGTLTPATPSASPPTLSATPKPKP